MTEETEKPFDWSPEGERKNQLQNLVAIEALVRIGQPVSTRKITRARERYLGKYLEFGGDDKEVLESLGEEWTAGELGSRLSDIGKKI